VVDVGHHVGVVELRQDARLPLEAGAGRGVVAVDAQSLEGDLPARERVAGAVHLGGPSAGDALV
jgi:hypothetical protein